MLFKTYKSVTPDQTPVNLPNGSSAPGVWMDPLTHRGWDVYSGGALLSVLDTDTMIMQVDARDAKPNGDERYVAKQIRNTRSVGRTSDRTLLLFGANCIQNLTPFFQEDDYELFDLVLKTLSVTRKYADGHLRLTDQGDVRKKVVKMQNQRTEHFSSLVLSACHALLLPRDENHTMNLAGAIRTVTSDTASAWAYRKCRLGGTMMDYIKVRAEHANAQFDLLRLMLA